MAQKIVYMDIKNIRPPGLVYKQINELHQNPEETPEITEEEDHVIEYDENNISKYLENDDNIIIGYGQKITLYSRREVLKQAIQPVNVYTDENRNKFVQIVGRHLIPYVDLEYLCDTEYSIYNVSTLLNVILVTNASTGARQKRSYYELKCYIKEDLEQLKHDSKQ